MHSIPWLAGLAELSTLDLWFLALGIIVAWLAAGFIIDLVMRDAGVGPYADGILALIGVCAGIYLRYRLFALYRPDDLYLTVGWAIGTAFLLLFGLGMAKSRLS
jgi:hypothetical protein